MAFCQVLFDVITLDWRNLIVDFLHLLRNYIYCLHDGAEFSKTYPSFLTIKEGSTSHLGLLSSGEKKETALRCSEPLRSKVGGPSKVFAMLCGATVLKLSNCWQYMPTFELTLIFSIYLKSSFLSFFKIFSSSTFGNPNPAHF